MSLTGNTCERRTGLRRDAALDDVEHAMRRLTRGHAGCLLGRIGAEHLDGGGKRLRARLALAAAEALGARRGDAVSWAAAVELLHNASLIHDDLQDGDRVRRGRPTTWAEWGPVQAINAGDLLLLLPFVALSEVPASAEVRAGLSLALARAGSEMARGQAAEPGLLDVCRAGEDPWRAYEACARGKTGALFGVPAEGAALIAGLDACLASALGAAFVELGVLFQLQDDVLDLFGDKGRNRRGNDLREGKVSALVAAHLEGGRRDPWLLSLLESDGDDVSEAAIDEGARRFRESGALAGVLARIVDLSRAVRGRPVFVEAPALLPLVDELVAEVLAPIAHLDEMRAPPSCPASFVDEAR